MVRCPVCEGLLNPSLFRPGSSVCRVCEKKLQERDSRDSQPRRSMLEVHLDLLVAIRVQAESEDDIDTWEAYWLCEEPWRSLWDVLRDSSSDGLSDVEKLKL